MKFRIIKMIGKSQNSIHNSRIEKSMRYLAIVLLTDGFLEARRLQYYIDGLSLLKYSLRLDKSKWLSCLYSPLSGLWEVRRNPELNEVLLL